jgi:hypothetical protein
LPKRGLGVALEIKKAPPELGDVPHPHWMIIEHNECGEHDIAWGFDSQEDAELFAEKYEQGGVDLLFALTRLKQLAWSDYEWRFLRYTGSWARDFMQRACEAATGQTRPQFGATLKALRDGKPMTPAREAVLEKVRLARLRPAAR